MTVALGLLVAVRNDEWSIILSCFWFISWDFAAIGLLEADYRANGIKNGYLKPQEYVLFSEQAYGISMMKVCEETGETNCREFSDGVSQNSTDGQLSLLTVDMLHRVT